MEYVTPTKSPPDGSEDAQQSDGDYWHALIDEKAAAAFLNLSPRTLQGFRQSGGGARFVRLSARCIKYRRADLREWTETRLRNSTSDPGTEAV